MKRILLFGVLFLAIACTSQEVSIAKLTANEVRILKNFESLEAKSIAKLIDDNESGETFKLCLLFVDKATKKVLKNQEISFYQTSQDGNYHPTVANDETTARINGKAITDLEGRIFIKTILPGSYATNGDNRHIHTKVFNAKPTAYDIHFAQYSNAKMKRFIAGHDQFFLVDLKQNNQKELVGFLTIEVKNPNTKR